MKRLVGELFGYALASGIALGVDTGLLLALTSRADWDYRPASVVSYTVGAAVAYILSVRFVFSSHRVRNRTAEFGYFLMLGVVGLGVNSVVMVFAVGTLGLKIVIAKGMAAACTFTTNFALRRQFLFRPRITTG
jgi:putative flippase GtrA